MTCLATKLILTHGLLLVLLSHETQQASWAPNLSWGRSTKQRTSLSPFIGGENSLDMVKKLEAAKLGAESGKLLQYATSGKLEDGGAVLIVQQKTLRYGINTKDAIQLMRDRDFNVDKIPSQPSATEVTQVPKSTESEEARQQETPKKGVVSNEKGGLQFLSTDGVEKMFANLVGKDSSPDGNGAPQYPASGPPSPPPNKDRQIYKPLTRQRFMFTKMPSFKPKILTAPAGPDEDDTPKSITASTAPDVSDTSKSSTPPTGPTRSNTVQSSTPPTGPTRSNTAQSSTPPTDTGMDYRLIHGKKFDQTGRRIGKTQNSTWPVTGKYQTMDAGPELGEAFNGIYMPWDYIDQIKKQIEQARASKGVNEKGEGHTGSIQTTIDPRAAVHMDVDLVEEALREMQGETATPWTEDMVYNEDVRTLNKEVHNKFRARNYAGPLEYTDDEEMISVPRKYAKELAHIVAYNGLNALKHNDYAVKDKQWSENIYAAEWTGAFPKVVVSNAIEMWYSESKFFKEYEQDNPRRDKDAPVTGHFTCLVWRASKWMAYGLALHKNENTGKTYVVFVVNYDPPGNFVGHFKTNVIKEGSYLGREKQLPEPYNAKKQSENQISTFFGGLGG